MTAFWPTDQSNMLPTQPFTMVDTKRVWAGRGDLGTHDKRKASTSRHQPQLKTIKADHKSQVADGAQSSVRKLGFRKET